MARRNTPDRAYLDYVEPLEHALGCIVSERVSVMQRTRFEVGPAYLLALNRNTPVMLRGDSPFALVAGQRFRVIEDDALPDGPFRVQVVGYKYALSDASGREILAFHWTPEADPDVQRTTPHLHVGSVNIAPTAPLVPRPFNKLHIPTGFVSIQAIVRFLIEELAVPPRRRDWRDVLDREHGAIKLPDVV